MVIQTITDKRVAISKEFICPVQGTRQWHCRIGNFNFLTILCLDVDLYLYDWLLLTAVTFCLFCGRDFLLHWKFFSSVNEKKGRKENSFWRNEKENNKKKNCIFLFFFNYKVIFWSGRSLQTNEQTFLNIK